MEKQFISEKDFLIMANKILKEHPKNNRNLVFTAARMEGEHISTYGSTIEELGDAGFLEAMPIYDEVLKQFEGKFHIISND